MEIEHEDGEHRSAPMEPIRRMTAIFVALGLGLVLAAGIVLVELVRGGGGLEITGLMRAGAATAQDAVGADNDVDIPRLRGELALIAGYAIVAMGACRLKRYVSVSPRRGVVARAGFWAAGLAGAVAVIAIGLLSPASPWLPGSAGATILGVTLLVPATVIAGHAVLVTLARTLRPRGSVMKALNRLTVFKQFWPPPLAPETPPRPFATDQPDAKIRVPRPVMRNGGNGYEPWLTVPTGLAGVQDAADARWRYAQHLPPNRKLDGVGICLSGGGIRSGSVALGALQELQRTGRLRQADYLVSVSGGGYAAGAFQLALSTSGGRETDATKVFAAGSVEEDHVRRHGRYIADNFKEWAVALGVVLRGVLASLALLAMTVIVAGLVAYWFYDAFPFVTPPRVESAISGQESDALREIPRAAWDIVSFLAIAAAGTWIIALLAGWCRWLLCAAGAMAGIGLLLALLWLGIPALAWLFVELVSVTGVTTRGTEVTTTEVTSTGIISALLTYVATLAAILWRGRETVSTTVGTVRSWFGRKSTAQPQTRTATGPVQYLIVITVLLALAAGYLLLLGGVIATAAQWHLGWKLGIPAVLIVVALLVDQTWLSLHPFYRRRLATAFAVRRRRLENGDVAAEPYDYRSSTPLAEYGKPQQGFPQVIFAAAAQLSGNERTPPGRRAASITFSSDWVGGPDVGWVDTAYLQECAGRHMNRDLTVQAAMAISGAAFASAMGRHASVFQTLFALSNARLGAWLPNPAHLMELQRNPRDWRIPLLPSIRRLPYLLRELAGRFPCDERLLLCTDGAHYENLGLVELLRHRPRLVYCFDASGDAPPFARTLAEAITLAQEELGIVISLENAFDLIPGSGEPLEPRDTLATINARLSKSAVCVGTIDYGEADTNGQAPKQGLLVVAKAVLTPDMPYELLSHAATDPFFPNNSTGDQWFEHDQFNAYLLLGRHLARQAVEAVDRKVDTPTDAGVAAMTPLGETPLPPVRGTAQVDYPAA